MLVSNILRIVALVSLVGPAQQEGLPVRPVVPHEYYQDGIEKLDRGEWRDALPICEHITKTNPTDGWGWMGLGWSLHYTGNCRAALPAYERALNLGGLPPYRIMQEIARCHVTLGDTTSAIAWVKRALDSGFPSVDQLRTDRHLEPLHGLAAFRALFVAPSAAAGREAGWHSDLDLLAREIERIHYSARLAFGAGELAAAVADLKRRVATASDEELTTGVMRLLRRLGDGHTYAEPPYMIHGREQDAVAIPLLFGHFEEGIFLTATIRAREDLLWARMLRIDGTPIEQVFQQLAALVPQDNDWRPRSKAPEYMRYPQILRGLGIASASDRLRLTVVDRGGQEREVTVAVHRGPVTEWIRTPAGHPALAKYVVSRQDWYWFERLPGTRTMYVQFNACLDKDAESLEAFSDRLAAALQGADVERLVVDLRWNGGGNNFVNRPLLETIIRAKQNHPGRLFVIAGRHTFSAAMIFAAQLERYTHAIFVGEPTGSSPNFVGETTMLALPFTGMRASLSNLYWQTSHATDFRTWIPPMLFVPVTFADYRGGRDAALQAILEYPERP